MAVVITVVIGIYLVFGVCLEVWCCFIVEVSCVLELIACFALGGRVVMVFVFRFALLLWVVYVVWFGVCIVL